MKTIKIMIAFVLCVAFSISFSANTVQTSEFFYENEETTVIFSTDSILSTDKKQIIADKLVYGNDTAENNVSTYSWCWLTGHDLVSEIVTVVTHKVRTTVPRCDKKTYEVESCTKCDHVQETLVSSVKYTCCPVD